MKNAAHRILPFIALAAAFVLASYAAHHFEPAFGALIRDGGAVSVAAFILLTAAFVVCFIPLDIVFLIPLGTITWGPVPTACMSITGWTLGSGIAFLIARTWGVSILRIFVPLERLYALEKRIPTENLFFSVVLLRMSVPVDILSYALGLFSTMPWRSYLLATALSTAPFGFVFAYAGSLPLREQLLVIALSFGTAAVILTRSWRKSS